MPCWIWWSLGQPKRVGKESSYLSNKWHICHGRNYNWLWLTVLHVRFPQHMEHSSENNENEWRQLLFIPMNSFLRQNISKRELALEHVAHQFAWQLSNWFGLTNRQSSCLSDQSVTKTTIFAPLWGSHLLGKEMRIVYPQKEPQQQCAQLFAGSHFPPSTQPFTNGSNRAIEHSLGTSTSPTSATKSILKQHSLQFPHYFTCQTHTKQSRKAKCSSGAPQHTSCQPQLY